MDDDDDDADALRVMLAKAHYEVVAKRHIDEIASALVDFDDINDTKTRSIGRFVEKRTRGIRRRSDDDGGEEGEGRDAGGKRSAGRKVWRRKRGGTPEEEEDARRF